MFDDFWSIHTFPQQKTWGFPEWIQTVAGGMNIVLPPISVITKDYSVNPYSY